MNASTSSFAFHFFFFFWVVAALLGDFLHPSCIHGKHFTLASSNWLNSNIDPCFVKTEMGVLGLSHLYRKEADYFAYSDGDNQFYFNLCGPTVDPRCNGAGACLASRKKIQQNWVPLGSSSTVSISYNEKKEIIYSMKGTQPCTESSTPGTTLSLDIHLVCANEETRPQFHYVEDRCHFHLSMRTPRVCDQPVDHQNCEWDQYSLAPLRRSIDTKVEGKSTSYFLNVCGPLTSTSCGENATVCATYSSSSTIAIGNHAGKLALDNGTLTWSATGQPCPDGTQSSTEIRFPCFHSLQTSPKVIFGRDLCGKTIFEWPSSVGCPVTASSSGGGLGTFFLVIFILFVSYFGIGYLFLHFKLGYEGWEALPHYESIRQFIDWIRFKWSGAGRIRI